MSIKSVHWVKERLFPRLLPVHLVAVIVLVSVGTYGNTLFNGFVYDDTLQILDNHWIRDVRNIPQIFLSNVWGFSGEHVSNYYRPLMHVIYMMTYYLFGLAPWGFHLMNVLLHAVSSVLVFGLSRRLLDEVLPATAPSPLAPPFMAALLFATHPVHTEAVAWLGGIPDLSFTLFFLLSLYLYLRSHDADRPSRGIMYLLSVICFALATLCKEPALTLPIIIVAYDLLLRKETLSFSSSVKRYAPFLGVAGLYFVVRFAVLHALTPMKSHDNMDFFQLAVNVFSLLAQYFQKLLLPVDLNAYYVFHPIGSAFDTRGIVSLIFMSILAYLCYISIKKSKAAFWCLLLIVIPLLPALYIPAFKESAFAERYLYLPSVGFVLLIALSLRWVMTNRPRAAGTTTFVLAALACLFALATVDRNAIWKNNITLWSDTARKSPDSANVQGDLGDALVRAGLVDEGRKHLNMALSLKPELVKQFLDKGIVYFNMGFIDKAIEEFETALLYKPDSAEAHNNLGAAYGEKGMTDKAIAHFEAAVKIKPHDPTFKFNLAGAYRKRSAGDAAIIQREKKPKPVQR